MNTASLELCKELYELSGWRETDEYWLFDPRRNDWELTSKQAVQSLNAMQEQGGGLLKFDFKQLSNPAYDLGFLLRKLPTLPRYGAPYVGQANNGEQYTASFMNWWAIWEYDNKGDGKKWHNEIIDKGYNTLAATPEDAVCELAVELFRQGVLSK